MKKRYEHIEPKRMEELFPKEYFRLIPEAYKKIPGGATEIPVKVDLKKSFAKTLNFSVPWDGELYGFVRYKAELFEKTGYDNTVAITISDWDNQFTLIFEDDKGNEKPVYSTSKEDIKTLLEGCIKPEKL
ncbi:MAG: hypothetical protein R3Y62_04880 [Eubacteriales bacterium]